MSIFKKTDFKVSTEREGKEVRVVKLENQGEPEIQDFQFNRIAKAGDGDYAAIKAKYGALAATDQDRASRSQKDRRFSLNSLLRDPLSVEQEERRVIEEKVRVGVEALADKVRSEAAASGYKDGLEKGYQEAYAKFQEEGKGHLARLEKFLAEVESAKEDIFRANERFLIELIYRIARTVLLKELAMDREHLLRLASELMERVSVRENVTLRISHQDADAIGMLKDGLEKAVGHIQNLTIEPSTTVAPGGCAVETEWSAIDANIETQLQGIYDALIGRDSASAGKA